MTTEDEFQNALDETPDAHHLRMVFADWLDERGDERAAGYRALGGLRRIPYRSELSWTKRPVFRWSWLCAVPGCRRWGMDRNVDTLPIDWYELTGVRVDRRSRRAAEDVAARAFARLPAARRARLLAKATGAGR